MKKRILTLLACSALLAACSTEGDRQELSQWMEEASRNLKGKVDAMPEVKLYEPVAYDVRNMVDPFTSTRVVPEKLTSSGGSGVKPPAGRDVRPAEPLEAFPLESLKYIGIITRQKESFALIAIDGALHQVKAGNYLGQNFGVITKIDESEVSLTELVQDAAGDWVERISSLQLQGQEGLR